MLNATVFVIATFLWMVNRQFHLSKKKHSYDKEPLRPLKPLKTAKKSSIRVLKKAKRGLINQVRKKRGVTIIDDASERDEGEVEFEKVLEEEKPKYRSHSTFLEDVEEDEGKALMPWDSGCAITCHLYQSYLTFVSHHIRC